MYDESSNLQYLNMHWNAAHHHNRYMRNSNAWLPVAVDRECAYRQMAKYSMKVQFKITYVITFKPKWARQYFMAAANDGMDFIFRERFYDAKLKIANATRRAADLVYYYCIYSRLTDFVFILSKSCIRLIIKSCKENEIIWQT